METREIVRQYRNSAAENFGSLSLGIFAVSLISRLQWATITLIIFGVIIALCGIYLIFRRDLKQKWFLNNVATPRNMAVFKRVGWLIVLAMFGVSLTQTDILWLKITGILFAFLAYIIFFISIWKLPSKES